MNTCIISGRLTRDIEVNYTPTQMAVGKFSLAVDRGDREKNTDFINCVAFGKQAETLEKYVGKGCRLSVQGHIQTSSYEKNGQKYYRTDVIVDRFDIIDWKNDNDRVEEEMPDSFEALNEDVPF